MLQHNLEENMNPLSKDKTASGASCQGCGTILIPEWTSRTSIINKAASKKPVSKAKSKRHRQGPAIRPDKVVRTDCLICDRYVEVPLPPPPSRKSLEKLVRTNPSENASLDTASPISQEAVKSATANTSSKQRARARKKGGLQALLEKSKSSVTPSSGFGLDLSDLMKQD